MARPKLTCAGFTNTGLPSACVKLTFISGIALSACTMAYPMRCVNDTLPPRARRRWLLITMRLSISSLAGTARTLVAVGTVRLVSMLATTRAAAPRSGCECAPAAGPLVPPAVVPPAPPSAPRPAGPGPAAPGRAPLGRVPLGPVPLGPVSLGPVSLGPVSLGPVSLGPVPVPALVGAVLVGAGPVGAGPVGVGPGVPAGLAAG